jgi:hypothetical protein
MLRIAFLNAIFLLLVVYLKKFLNFLKSNYLKEDFQVEYPNLLYSIFEILHRKVFEVPENELANV